MNIKEIFTFVVDFCFEIRFHYLIFLTGLKLTTVNQASLRLTEIHLLLLINAGVKNIGRHTHLRYFYLAYFLSFISYTHFLSPSLASLCLGFCSVLRQDLIM